MLACMRHTVATVNLKGGVGKSTLATNLATCFHRAGHKTLLVDADYQGTARTWASMAKDASDIPPVVAMDARNILKDLPRVGADYEIVVIDTPARLGKEARAAMLSADLVLIPVGPEPADVWALDETIDVLEEARALEPELRARVVFNRADSTSLSALVERKLADFGIEVLAATLGNRVVVGKAMLNGSGVASYAPTSDAATEMMALFKAVRKILQTPITDDAPEPRPAPPTSSGDSDSPPR
jgi:chromosome partitioning protein